MSSEGRFPRATPESQGVSSSALLGFVDALETQLDGAHSVIVLRHGHVIAEGWWAPYRADRAHALYSVSKSFTSTAIGLLVQEGRLTLDDRVVDLLPEDAPSEIDERLAALHLRHLLSMTTGHERDGLEDAPRVGGWARHILAEPVVHQPGTRFMYQTGASYLLAAIATRLTGQRLLDYLGPRLLAPLGIEDATWERGPDGVDVGGFGLSARTEDIAAFGQLLLQRGAWQGWQLVPGSWVTDATSRHVGNGDPELPSDWTQGYGFQFWRGRHGSFRGDGAFGQLCLVLPDQEVVVAVTAGLADMQAEMDVLWDSLLPALGDGGSLPADPSAHARLSARLEGLSLPMPNGAPASPRSPRLGGRTYRLEGDDRVASLSIRQDGGEVEMRLLGPTTDARIRCGHGCWLEGGVAPPDSIHLATDREVGAAAGAYAWVSVDHLRVHVWAVDTPIGWTIDVVLDDADAALLEMRQNVAFVGPPVIRATGVAADTR